MGRWWARAGLVLVGPSKLGARRRPPSSCPSTSRSRRCPFGVGACSCHRSAYGCPRPPDDVRSIDLPKSRNRRKVGAIGTHALYRSFLLATRNPFDPPSASLRGESCQASCGSEGTVDSALFAPVVGRASSGNRAPAPRSVSSRRVASAKASVEAYAGEGKGRAAVRSSLLDVPAGLPDASRDMEVYVRA